MGHDFSVKNFSDYGQKTLKELFLTLPSSREPGQSHQMDRPAKYYRKNLSQETAFLSQKLRFHPQNSFCDS
jgi:hypothetical protein